MAPKIYTLDELKAWTPERRLALYNNAKKQPAGQYIVDIIEKNYLPLSSGGLSSSDPTHLKMVDLIWSEAGRKAVQEASAEGMPPLCAIDKMLQSELGDRYNKHDFGTASAGAIVADLMRHLGYVQDGWGYCPAGCTAKTALRWSLRNSN
ncbi:hypothetical protein [Methylobacterium sp. Leaf91]|uniref:hypothetical protein n=1 Tax=Methylobacterium sp. Leaf91 TaxID=1736247 RepID=UPI0012E7A13F|nr:hypothetical protein [Methylobacterium sp. Leaf91]